MTKHHNSITGVCFIITDTRLYVSILSIYDNIDFLENVKQGFKRTITWNRYRSEITALPENNNLGYLIGPTFRNINRLFVLSFKNGNNGPTKYSFDYMKSKILILIFKDFNFSFQRVKNKQEIYEKLIEISRNDYYTTRNLY